MIRNKPLLIGTSIIAIFSLIAILAPIISPYDQSLIDQDNLLMSPSREHLLGTDSLGRDILSIHDPDDEDDVNVSGGNKTSTLRWNHLFNNKLFQNTSLIYSNFNYSINISEEAGENIEIISKINDLTLKEDLQYFMNPTNSLNFGFQYIYHTYQPFEFALSGNDEDVNVIVGKRSAQEYALYLSHNFVISNKLKLDYGLRYSQFSAALRADQFDLDKIEEANEFYDIVFHEHSL